MSSKAESKEQRGGIHSSLGVVLGGVGDLRAGEKVRNRDGRDGARTYSPSFHSWSSIGWMGVLRGMLERVAFEYPRGVRSLVKANSWLWKQRGRTFTGLVSRAAAR